MINTCIKKELALSIIVHCSTGYGFTTEYIVLHYTLHLFQNETKDKNKNNILKMEDNIISIINNGTDFNPIYSML